VGSNNGGLLTVGGQNSSTGLAEALAVSWQHKETRVEVKS